MTVEIKITKFRLRNSRDDPSHTALAYFNVEIPGVEIRRCRLVRYHGRIVVRGPAYNRKQNRGSYGEIQFTAATYRAISKAAVAIFVQTSGDHAEDEPIQPIVDDQPAAVLPFPPTRLAAHG